MIEEDAIEHKKLLSHYCDVLLKNETPSINLTQDSI